MDPVRESVAMDIPLQVGKIASVAARAPGERIALVALAPFVVAAWMLQHPYPGIIHDAQIYSLLALAHLHPQHLSYDIYLRFGSQDRYTVFSPIFAAAIRWLDLDPAAALLTLVSQAAFFGCAYLLLSRFVPGRLALLGVGLLAVLPTDYGAFDIFHCTENFLTPRLAAEALVLAGLAAGAASRYALGGVCILIAMAFHPIIGSAGIAVALCACVAVPRPRLTLVLFTCGLLVSLLLATSRQSPFARLDPAWFQIVRENSPFLFPSEWPLRDWSRACVPLAVLACGFLTARDERVRRLCIASLITAAGGLLLTLIYCDGLKVIIATDAQMWRWLWLTTVLAIGLAPVIARDCWNCKPGMPAVPILLTAAYLLRSRPEGAILSLVAVACAAVAGRMKSERAARLLLSGAALVFVVSLATYLVLMSSAHQLNAVSGSIGSIIVQAAREHTRDGIAWAAVLVVLWNLSERVASVRAAALLAGAGALACAALAPSAARSWMSTHYTQRLANQFAQWRRQIPPRAEVMWSEMPVGTWYLLDRPSYYSEAQVPGPTFSRSKALEIERRQAVIRHALDEGGGAGVAPSESDQGPPLVYADRAHPRQLALMCQDAALAYVVTWSNIGPTPFKPIAPDAEKPRNQLHLYSCTPFRGGVEGHE
jgi:hypothetical protein